MTESQIKKLVPLGHRVLIKPDPINKTSAGGIFLAVDEKLEKAGQQIGTIVALGEDCWKAFRKINQHGKEVNGLPWVKLGDKVLYSRFAGKFVGHPDTKEEFTIMNDEDILIRIE